MIPQSMLPESSLTKVIFGSTEVARNSGEFARLRGAAAPVMGTKTSSAANTAAPPLRAKRRHFSAVERNGEAIVCPRAIFEGTVCTAFITASGTMYLNYW